MERTIRLRANFQIRSEHVSMDEQQVNALLKRMAKLEAENASLKQQIDKKNDDKEVVDLTEPEVYVKLQYY